MPMKAYKDERKHVEFSWYDKNWSRENFFFKKKTAKKVVEGENKKELNELMSVLPEKQSLQQNRVFLNINLKGRGGPTTDSLD